MTQAAGHTLLSCRNCAASLSVEPAPLHCPRCGQRITPLTAREFVHDALARYARTIGLLIARPGTLTSEHLSGRRQRYVPPLRLYLNASLLFFLIVKVLGFSSEAHIQIAPVIDARGKPITAQSDPAAYRASIAEMHACVDHPGSCSWGRTMGARIGLKAEKEAEHPQTLADRFIGMAPYAVFVLLPVFAALIMLVYRRRHLRYGTHLVFSLHAHAFWFAALTLIALLPGIAAMFALLVLPIYAVWAMQRMYGGRIGVTLARAAVVGVCYLIALILAIQGLGIASILSS